MLARLFSKTKPINYLIILALVMLAFVLLQFSSAAWPVSLYDWGKKGVLFFVVLLSVSLTQFIVQKNRLVKRNVYTPFLFACFLLMFPSTLLHTKAIIANFFILLAFRRIFSLHSLKTPQEKLFDASLWILVAALFHFWSIFYLLLLFVAVTLYVGKEYRNWIIPIIAFLAVFVFLSIYLVLSGETYVDWFYSKTAMSFDFTEFESVFQNIALAVFSSIALLFFIAETIQIKEKPFNMQSSYKKILIAFLIGVGIYIVSPEKNQGVLLFTFFPLSVLGANYIESRPRAWMQEVVVLTIAVLSVFFFCMEL